MLGSMKIRIGYGPGADAAQPERLGQLVVELERLGFDSLWLSEVITQPNLDPLTGLAFAAGRVAKLKLGTTLVVPGRQPVRLAKELATVDQLSNGRLLLVFVPGLPDDAEADALGVRGRARNEWIEECLPLVRRLWTEADVAHVGQRFRFDDVTVRPRPKQTPLEVWLGGTAPSALDRNARLGEGWLPSLLTPDEAARGRETIERLAAGYGRAIDPEHFGVSIGYSRGPVPEARLAAIARRRRDLDPSSVVPTSLEALRGLLERYVAAGCSKFVVRPLTPAADWRRELEELAACVLPLQT
jgi:probable F420-dependent oxidoreductase